MKNNKKEKKELKDLPTPIEFLLNNSYHNQDYAYICKEAFKFFLRTEVEFLYDKKNITTIFNISK